MVASRSQLASWQSLEKRAQELQNTHLKTLFANDDARFNTFSVQAPGILFDYSKQLINQPVKDDLLRLAEECELAQWRDKMFAGEKINFTEQRAVLHSALRNRDQSAIIVDGENVSEQVETELEKMRAFVAKVRSGE